jgi:hypothetical protein
VQCAAASRKASGADERKFAPSGADTTKPCVPRGLAVMKRTGKQN